MFVIDAMTRKQTYASNTATSQPLSLPETSHLIAKVKPKIRIIHIFAPEIIKTDVANFRELVQKLTGKPGKNNSSSSNGNNKRRAKPRREDHPRAKRVELWPSRLSDFQEEVKEKEGISGSGINQNSGGFLSGFADLDGFMQELSEFQMLPIDARTV